MSHRPPPANEPDDHRGLVAALLLAALAFVALVATGHHCVTWDVTAPPAPGCAP